MSAFDNFGNRHALAALVEAANTYLDVIEKRLQFALSEPISYLQDPKAYEEELRQKIIGAKNAIEVYQLALAAVASPLSGPGLVTYVRIKTTPRGELPYDSERGGPPGPWVDEYLVGPLFDDQDFESCFSSESKSLFSIGKTSLPFSLQNLKPGSTWENNEKIKGYVHRFSVSKVVTIRGFGKATINFT